MLEQKNDGDFHVSLNGIQLSEASRNRIQAGIQKLVMDELAGYYPNPDDDDNYHRPYFGSGVIVVKPKYWWGYILRAIREFEVDNIKGLSESIQSKSYGQF